MKLKKLLLMCAVAVVPSVLFANPAAAAWKWWFTCNSDGFVHVHMDNGMGEAEAVTNRACGPGMAQPGDAFDLVITGTSQVGSAGRQFLAGLEKPGAAMTSRSIPAERGAAERGATERGAAERGAAARGAQGRSQSIRLHPADVGPHLAAFLTGVSPDWQGEWPGKWVCCIERTLKKSPPGTEYWVPGHVSRPPSGGDRTRVLGVGTGTVEMRRPVAVVPLERGRSSTASISPANGPTQGGTRLTIVGDFSADTRSLIWGGTEVPARVSSGGDLVVVAPEGEGTVQIRFGEPGGAPSNVMTYTYDAPQLAAISPAAGPAAGGIAITLTGSNFGLNPTVWFGDQMGTIRERSHTRIVVISPAASAGAPDVVEVRLNGSRTPSRFPPGSGGVAFTYQRR